MRDKDSREPAVVVRGLERHVTADDGPGAAALPRRAPRTCSLTDAATDTPCPAQEPFVYPFEANAPGTFDATCEGNAQFNGFYGEGIVNAAAAVGAGNRGRN